MEMNKQMRYRKKYVIILSMILGLMITLLGCGPGEDKSSDWNKNDSSNEGVEFSKNWYETYSFFESDSGDLLEIEILDDGLVHVKVNKAEYFACDGDKYTELEDGAYAYDDAWDDFLQLKYYPKEQNRLVMVVMGEETSYYPIESTEELDKTVTFSEDWYLTNYYYIDSNGDYFILKHSDSIFQINIAEEGEFNVDFSKYRMEQDAEDGDVYIYYDIDSYILVKYYPQLNHTIKIEAESGDIICTNISEEEYLEAERNYANSQMEGFEANWYINKYISSSPYESWKDLIIREGCTFDEIITDIRPISHKQITNACDVFMLEVNPPLEYMSEKPVIDFLSDNYSMDYENYGYIYESTYLETLVYLEYFPKDNKIKVYDEYEHMGNMVIGKDTYYLLTEEEVEELTLMNK